MNRAIVYIAYGKEYVDQALRSAKSANGQFPCVICRPGDWRNGAVETFKLPERKYTHWYLDRVRYFNLILDKLDYDQILILDTDTYVCGDLTDFFTALDRFDIVGTQAIAQQTLWREDIPASFPELHCGAFAFSRNQRIHKLFSRWLEVYKERVGYFGNNDQTPLREVLWQMKDVRLGILPDEFCFRFRWGGLLARKVKVLHGKEHGTSYEEVARQVNEKGGIRVYHRKALT
jgi:hypothetical protein